MPDTSATNFILMVKPFVVASESKQSLQSNYANALLNIL